MRHFENPKNVKKRQGACFQTVTTLARIAQIRPWDFNFRILQPQSVKTRVL